jgi:altronate dehydratase small subunit
MTGPNDPRLLLLDTADNVFAVARAIAAGESVMIEGADHGVDRVAGLGFKLARQRIRAGEKIIKYGAVIGVATADIAPGHLVHSHNVESTYLPSTEAIGASIAREKRS